MLQSGHVGDDGSYGEGGGQVLRTSLSLAALTGQPVHLYNVRAGRTPRGWRRSTWRPWSRPADLRCGRGRCGPGLDRDLLSPVGRPWPGTYVFDVTEAAHRGSAGAVSLILQTLLPPLALTRCASHLLLRGGTHVPWSPSFEYLDLVYLPLLAEIGVAVRCRLDGWGFYPAGGGQITTDIYGPGSLPVPLAVREPGDEAGAAAPADAEEGAPDVCDVAGAADAAYGTLAPLDLAERGRLRRVTGAAVACNLPSHIPQRMASRAASLLADAGLPAEIVPRREHAGATGAYIFLRAEYEGCVAGFAALGSKGKPSEEVAAEAVAGLLAHHQTGAPVDMHLADQILLPLALAGGRSALHIASITTHLLTNAHVISQFLPVRITVEGEQDRPGTVVVESLES